MIRLTLAALASVLCFAAPAVAQSFSHSHGGHAHSHDTTIYTTSGTCCYDQGCGNSLSGLSTLAGAPAVTRTYARTYSQGPTITRTYKQAAPTYATSHRTYTHSSHRTRHGSHASHHPQHRDHGGQGSHHRSDDRAPIYHTDRGEAWAHYERRWKRRTNTRRSHTH